MICCQSCPRTYTRVEGPLAEQAARVAGWMIGEGPTMGGGHIRRVHCPSCLGRTNGEPDPEPKWDARCKTCGWLASDEEGYDDEPFTGDHAKRWERDHQCEPWVELIKPAEVRAREEAEAYLQSGEKARAS